MIFKSTIASAGIGIAMTAICVPAFATPITIDFQILAPQTTDLFQQDGVTITATGGQLDFQGDAGLGVNGGGRFDGGFGIIWIDSGETVTIDFGQGLAEDVILTERNANFVSLSGTWGEIRAFDRNGDLVGAFDYSALGFPTQNSPASISDQLGGVGIASLTYTASDADYGTALAAISFVRVNEPATLALFGLAGLGLMAARRRS